SPTPKPTRVFGRTFHDIQSLARAYCHINEVIVFSARGSVAGPSLKSLFRSPTTLSTILRNERDALQSSDRQAPSRGEQSLNTKARSGGPLSIWPLTIRLRSPRVSVRAASRLSLHTIASRCA